MTHNKPNKSKILVLILSFTMCLAFMLGIVFASPMNTVYAEEGVQIDTLGVAFKKVDVGDSLAAAFEFENETEKTLKVPAGANYTATLCYVSKNGQKTTLWDKNNTAFSWSRVENQLVEKNVAYCITVMFSPKEGYELSDDSSALERNLKVSGAEFGKGKDIELWGIVGRNAITTDTQIDFVISKGMTFMGYTQNVKPEIGVELTGKIGALNTDTGMWLRGAPGPYTYAAKNAPIGMEIQTSNIFGESTCYYRITAVNEMDGGTMYITATAADGQTCDIPVSIAAVSGGHEHTWVEEFGKIDFEHHGYTKCSDPSCPGVAPAFDKGSQLASHEFYSGCNAKCKMCGVLDNPDAKHSFTYQVDESDKACHVRKCACGEVEKDASGNVIKEKHSGGVQTCLYGARCKVCDHEYTSNAGHRYEFRSFKDNDGTYTHLGFCIGCGEEDVSLRHKPEGGVATCQARAKCEHPHNGDVCGCEYGEFKPHNFVGGYCTECHADEYIKDVLIDVPEYWRGMIYRPLFYPNVIKGNIIPKGDLFYKVSADLDGNNTLCNVTDCKTTFIRNNSVICYVFEPQTTCKFPASAEDINIAVTHGEVLRKRIREDGYLEVLVLLPLNHVVQSIDISVSRPRVGHLSETLQITEKNGCTVTINKIVGYLDNGKFYDGVFYYAYITIKAPEGKEFPILNEKKEIEKWLCKHSISGGEFMGIEQSTDLTELTVIIKTLSATDCLHENVIIKEAGKLATCTEDGVKDKYACNDCGKAFLDAACTLEWRDSAAKLPKTGHQLGSEYKAEKDKHYRVCKICGEKAEETPHVFGTLVGQTAPTCMQNGVKAHYECSVCKKLTDESRNETTLEDLIIPVNPGGHSYDVWKEEVPATAEALGTKGHKDCTVCRKHFDKDGNEITDLRIARIGTHNVTVNGESQFFTEGERVTVTAEAPSEGKEFVGWRDASGSIVSTDAEYTFTVTGEISLTAVYKDKISGGVITDDEISPAPEKKDEPSGGAIAGIVIGSVAAAGLGGFAIFWFAIKTC